MAEINLEFSQRLKEALSQAKLTQKELAQRVGVREVSISKYTKKGGVPEWDILVKISQTLNVSCDWLLTGKEVQQASGAAIAPRAGEVEPNSLTDTQALVLLLTEFEAWAKRIVMTRPEAMQRLPSYVRAVINQMEADLEDGWGDEEQGPSGRKAAGEN